MLPAFVLHTNSCICSMRISRLFSLFCVFDCMKLFILRGECMLKYVRNNYSVSFKLLTLLLFLCLASMCNDLFSCHKQCEAVKQISIYSKMTFFEFSIQESKKHIPILSDYISFTIFLVYSGANTIFVAIPV